MSKFLGFFSAPLLPVGVVLLIGVLIFAGGLIGAVPVVGEILAGILLGLALLGGFVMALIMICLVSGFSLMFPTIAVEASDGFDAISKAFSYVLYRPWRTAFYYVVGLVYGGVCYLFIHVLAFLLLRSVHMFAGWSMNWDGSSVAGLRGKLDAIWPTPTLTNLQPAVNWATLGWSETIGAALIWLWVALVAAAVLAFAVSLYFSISTVVYLLLRKHVDDTDLEDVYVEQAVEELVEAEPGAGAPPPAQEPPAGEQPGEGGGEEPPSSSGEEEGGEPEQAP
jgi:hypothetical protein